jgi:hypothetical protein
MRGTTLFRRKKWGLLHFYEGKFGLDCENSFVLAKPKGYQP